MHRKHILKVGVFILVIVLVTVQFLAYPATFTSASIPNPLSVFNVQNSSKVSSSVTKWILTLWSFVISDGRTVFESKERTDILLLMRKLLVFSVREVNQRLAGSPCVPWWVNPLSVTTFQEQNILEGVTEYNLTFEVHPGSIPFQSVVLRRKNLPNATHAYVSDDLVFVNAKRLDKSLGNCTNDVISSEISPVCLCPEDKVKAEKITAAARGVWLEKDPELYSWPPFVSMSVPDYINFFDMTLYLKNPLNSTNFCGTNVKLLIFISSAPTHFEQRQNIRKTFGNLSFLQEHGARMVFLFGVVNDYQLQEKLDKEFLEENDIVQANFVDSYHNLSLSHLSMYNWVVTNCKGQGSPRWMLKADDDFFLNIPLARRITEANPQDEMIGISFCGTKAIREVNYMLKYYVSRYMYAPDYYVGYPSGVAYLVRTDVLEPILKASLNTPIIHMDDAYVMGLLAREAGIRHKDSELITYRKAESPCDIVNMMSSYVTRNATLEYMWNQFQNLSQSTQCQFDESKLKVNPLRKIDYQYCLYNFD